MTGPAASPCIGVCRMDDATGWCGGCLRTLDEIADWSMLDEPARRRVCTLLARRRVEWRRRCRDAAAGVDAGPGAAEPDAHPAGCADAGTHGGADATPAAAAAAAGADPAADASATPASR